MAERAVSVPLSRTVDEEAVEQEAWRRDELGLGVGTIVRALGLLGTLEGNRPGGAVEPGTLGVVVAERWPTLHADQVLVQFEGVAGLAPVEPWHIETEPDEVSP